MKTILAPIDFSAGTASLIAEALDLAEATAGRLILLYVVEPLPPSASEFGFADAAARIATESENEAARRLALLQRQLRTAGLTAAVRQVSGDPGTAILDQAAQLSADYIVLGSHGHGAFYELIVGSTANRVLKESTCPVLIVPSGATPHPAAARLQLETAECAQA